MRFPKLEPTQATRQMVSVFRGLNKNDRIGQDEFADMENLSSDAYPLLSPRKPRGIYAEPERANGLIAKDGLCYVDGSKFVMNGYEIEMGLEDGEKQLVSMGAYVIIFPDKKYINTLDISDFGNLEAVLEAETVTLIPAWADGSEMTPAYIQPEEPGEPANMALWLDNSASPGSLKQWSAGTGMWVEVAEHYVRLEAPNIGLAFREGDGVTVSGLPEELGDNAVIRLRGDDFLLIAGLLERQTQAQNVTVSRLVPAMDFVIECGNRLWGCRYGWNRAGQVVNEIYASKLGDFRNWSCFAGVSTDSYAVSLGADGPFTGAIQHLGYPVFFRENCLHKIYGSTPASFRLQTTPCRGVQMGSGRSLAIVGETLYYKSCQGICAYDGSLPVEAGRELGAGEYHDAVAGSYRGKYYLSMADAGGEYHLFVWDTARNLWHREDGTRVKAFCPCREELYFLDDGGRILTVSGSGETEGAVRWMAQTGSIGVDDPDSKILARLTLRLWLAQDAAMKVWIRYDEDACWQPVTQLRGRPLGSVTLPMPVRRCDHLYLRLEGVGDMRLYSITKTMEQGSDVF